jgi:probable rRNA maturation factor
MLSQAAEARIEIQIDEQFRARISPDLLRQAALAALAVEKQFFGKIQNPAFVVSCQVKNAIGVLDAHQQVEEACELTVVVTGDDLLHDLNRRHRDVDAPTDVLAFPDEPCPERGHKVSVVEETQGPFVGAPELVRYLGDVIVSFPRASAQAAEAGHDVRAELQLLVVHGVLHLLGYDDVTEAQRARMWRAQAKVLEGLGVEINLPA